MSNRTWRGEIAQMDKVTGNEDKSSKVSPYLIEIKFGNDGEFHARATILRRDYNWRALSVTGLKAAIRSTFPDVRFQFVLSRSAELAVNPCAILKG